jgi:hypothetical protein
MNLKARAVERGVKQGDIARTLRVSEPTVSAWLKRDRPVPSDYVCDLAAMLQIDPVDILPPPKVTARPVLPLQQKDAT